MREANFKCAVSPENIAPEPPEDNMAEVLANCCVFVRKTSVLDSQILFHVIFPLFAYKGLLARDDSRLTSHVASKMTMSKISHGIKVHPKHRKAY